SIMLSHSRPIFAFGLTSGLICLALFLGTIISMFLSDLVLYTVVIGNIALAATMIIFFFIHKFQIQETPEPAMLGPEELDKLVAQSAGGKHQAGEEQAQTLEQVAPRALLGRLSDREKEVLELVLLKQMMFRKVAGEIGISESSVKTYMQRIYEKAGVKSKKGLKELLLTRKKP
ncbi:MAG: LuxR C-terminal-related transcriptional regulator, partial [Desulfonatronovibrio sp.]